MKISKLLKKYRYVVTALILLVIIGTIIYMVIKLPINRAEKQLDNYRTYQPAESEIGKLSQSINGDIYYYAADAKRYVFPNLDVYKSWFASNPVENVKLEDLETLYKTQLGGVVFLRPGTLLKSPTLLDVFMVEGKGNIRPVTDKKLLIKFYGRDWAAKVIELQDYYFTAYKITKPINSAGDFPDLPKDITINEDKSLK